MKTRIRKRSVVLVNLLVVFALLSARLLSAHAQDVPPPQASLEPEGIAEPQVVRIYVRDRQHLNAVAGVLDIWETHPDRGYVLALVTPEQYAWLQGLGYRLEVDAQRSAELNVKAPLDPRFYYFDDYVTNANGRYVVDFLQAINAAFPDLTELIDIGDAWLAGESGEYDRDIWVLRITNEDPAYGPIEDKPPFFLFATIHAREVATPELVIRYIRYLTEGYGGEGGYGADPDATWLVDHNVVYVLVMQNPDGHWKNEENTGNYRRKNLDNDDGCSDPDYWGVDLNRNHSFMWGCCGGSSGNPCDDTYRGPSPGSEPETQAFESYFATVMEDQNGPSGNDEEPAAAPDDATGIFISLHSYSDLVLWPWGFTAWGPAPNDAQLRTIGRKFAYFNGYDPSGTIWYDVDGATDDWTYGQFGVASYTFEVGSSYGSCGGFFPDYECIEGENGASRDFWAENLPAFLYAHKIARTPYMTAYGPDTEDVAVDPVVEYQGVPVELTAIATDYRLSGDTLYPIAGAEYFVGTPGEDGTGMAMSPVDGSWGDLSEAIQATVDTAGLSVGRHYILVHAQNNQGDWGPFTAVFLEIEPGSFIDGHVTAAGSGMPIQGATVRAITGTVSYTTTTEASGYYTMSVSPDTYMLAAWKYGYTMTSVSGVTVPVNTVHTEDLTLTETTPYSLTGCVTDDATGEPLSATVAVHGPFGDLITETETSQATGCYTLTIHAGDYTVSAAARLHQSEEVALALTGDTVEDFALQATTTDGIVWGQVTSGASGDPVIGATVEVTPGGESTETNANGEYELQTPSGPATVTVSLPPHTVVEKAVVVPQSNMLELNVALPTELRLAKSASTDVVEAGMELEYTIVVTNVEGPATYVVVTETLPTEVVYNWTSDGGSLEDGEVVWRGLSLPAGGAVTVTYGVMAGCVPTGTRIVNDAYRVSAPAWSTPTLGAPVTVTVETRGVSAAFSYDAPVVAGYPEAFTSQTENATDWLWSFGDGATAAEAHPAHAYGSVGPHTVVLTASNGCAQSVVSDVVEVETYALGALVEPIEAWGDPGEALTYTVRVTNTGTIWDRIALSATSEGWDAVLSADQVELSAGEGMSVVLTVTVPQVDGGAINGVTVLARSMMDPRAPAAKVELELLAGVNEVYGVALGAPISTQEGAAGETVEYTVRVTNTGNMLDTMTFTVHGNDWPAVPLPDSMAIAWGGRREIAVEVTIPLTAAGGSTDTVVVRATGSEGYDEVLLTTTAAWRTVYLPVVTR